MAETAKILKFPTPDDRETESLALRNSVAEFGRAVDSMLETMPPAMAALRAYAANARTACSD